jgi:hypothetical protein
LWQAASSKEARLHVVTHVLVPALANIDSELNPTYILHQDFRHMIANGGEHFIPTINPLDNKPKLGLAPLAFVPRSPEELHRQAHHSELLHHTTLKTSADIKRTKLGFPTPPATPLEVLNTIRLYAVTLHYLFTGACPLYKEVATLVSKLKAIRPTLDALQDRFAARYAPDILYAVTMAAHNFFSTHCTQEDINTGTLPTASLKHLLDNFSDGTIREPGLAGIPDYFKSKQALNFEAQQAHLQQQHLLATLTAQGHLQPSRKRPADPSALPRESPNRTPPFGTPQPRKQVTNSTRIPLQNHNLDPELNNHLATWCTTNAEPHLPFFLLLRGLNMQPNQAITFCGLEQNDCIRWALTGLCPGNCNRNHNNQIAPACLPRVKATLSTLLPTLSRPAIKKEATD